MKKMGTGVIALDRLPDLSMNNCFDLLPKVNRLPSFHFVGTYPLNGHYTSVYIGNYAPGAIAEDANIANLPAGIGVKRGVVENNVTFFASSQFGNALTVSHDGEHFAVERDGLLIAFENSFIEISIDGARGLLRSTFPGCTGALALLLHGAIKTFLVKLDALISGGVDHEVER